MRISKIHKRNENFNISGNVDTSGITLDPNLTPLYSNRVIEYAKILKAKNGAGKYSDEYYLEYAKGIDNREMKGAYNEVFHKKAAKCDIQDSKWRGFSYEEIIQMKNSGVKIPEEVLLWAEAQQESDVIAYEVISDEALIDDNTTTEEVAGDTNINSLQTKTKFYINKAEDTQKTNKQKIEEFETLSNKVSQIKNEKESSYKNAMNEISKLTNELEELDEKNKNGTLTQSEAKRYKELGKIVNSKNNIAINNMLKNSYEVDEFLSSIDSLNKEANNNLTLADDIQKTNDDLSNFDRKSNEKSATHNTKGIVYSNMGPLGDLLYGINTTSIEKVALDVRTELETNSNETLNTINSLENTELAEFAQNYTKTVNSLLPQTNANTKNVDANEQETTEQTNDQQTEKTQKQTTNASTQTTQTPNQIPENTQTTAQTPVDNTANTTTQTNTTSTETDTKEQTTTDDTNKENKTKQNNNQFTVVVGASTAAALAATVVSSVSTADLNTKETGLNTSSKAAQINFTKAQTDAKNLQKEQKTVEAEHEANMQEIEVAIANTQNNTATQDNIIDSTPVTTQTNIQTNANNNVEPQATTTTTPQEETQTDNTTGDKQTNTALAKEQELSAQITKAFTTSNLSAAKSEKAKTDLQAENSQFRARNLNNQEVAINTIVTGTATTAFGAYNMSIAIPMLQSGISLMLNPFTYAVGQTLTTLATQEIIQATAQIATGTAANVAGGVGLAASDNASKTINTTNQTLLAAQKSNQDNLKIIQEASKSGLVTNPTEGNNQNNNTNTQNQTPETELLQTPQNVPTTPQNTQQTPQPEQNEIQTRVTQNSQETEQVNKKTTDANQTISTQTNKVDEILEENTKTSQQLEEKIANLNSGTPNVNEKEDTTGDIRKLQRKLENTSDDSDKFIEEKKETTSEIPVQEEEQITPVDNNSDDTNLLAASATTSANINNTTTTDDKATRKLERFNNDSIIESKKKKKKVMAVSAASGGSVKG